MPSFKFSILFLILFGFQTLALEDNKCLQSQFEVEVIHKGQPLGLLPVVLRIKKKGCLIDIYHEHFKFLKNNWSIDVCREPVHIKKGVGAVQVLKKTGACNGKSDGAFCSDRTALFQKIQDDGLIFAEGQKETLDTDHGKTYCAYLLAKKYLDDSLVFNRGEDYSGVLQGSSPMKKEVEVEIKKEMPTTAPRPIVEGVATPDLSEESSSDTSEENSQGEVPQVEPSKTPEAGVGSF